MRGLVNRLRAALRRLAPAGASKGIGPLEDDMLPGSRRDRGEDGGLGLPRNRR